MVGPVTDLAQLDIGSLDLEAEPCDPADSWCTAVYNMTHSKWLAQSADWLVAKPLTILLILVIAFVIRGIARRLIDRLTRANSGGKVPALLRPLKERAPQALGSLLSE